MKLFTYIIKVTFRNTFGLRKYNSNNIAPKVFESFYLKRIQLFYVNSSCKSKSKYTIKYVLPCQIHNLYFLVQIYQIH